MAQQAQGSELIIGPIVVNARTRTVKKRDGSVVQFTGAEFNALHTLVAAMGAPVSRADLCRSALGRAPSDLRLDRSVDQLVFSLRAKLPRDDDGQVLIRSVRGFGYWIREADVQA